MRALAGGVPPSPLLRNAPPGLVYRQQLRASIPNRLARDAWFAAGAFDFAGIPGAVGVLQTSPMLAIDFDDPASLSRSGLLQTFGRRLHCLEPISSRRVLCSGCADQAQVVESSLLATTAWAADMANLLLLAKIEICAISSGKLCDKAELRESTFLRCHGAAQHTGGPLEHLALEGLR